MVQLKLKLFEFSEEKKNHILLSFQNPIEIIILFNEILTLMKLCSNWRKCNIQSRKLNTI